MNALPPDDPNTKIRIKESIVGTVCVLSAQLLFGTTFACNKLVLDQHVNPIQLASNRAIIATLFLFPFFWAKRHTTRWTWPDWKTAIFVGAFAATFGMIFEYAGTKYTLASNASLIISTESIFSVFLCVLILKERLRFPTAIGGLSAVVGMTVVLWSDFKQVEFQLDDQFLGDILVLTSVLFWGLYTVYSKRVVHHSDPIYTIFYVTCFNAIALGAIDIARSGTRDLTDASLNSWLVTIYLGVFCSGLGHLLYFQALKRLPASLVAVTLTLLPVFGVCFSMVLLDESLNLSQIIGSVTIVLGIGYAVWPRNGDIDITDNLPPGQ